MEEININNFKDYLQNTYDKLLQSYYGDPYENGKMDMIKDILKFIDEERKDD